MSDRLLLQCINTNFCAKLSWSSSETLQILSEVYGADAVKTPNVSGWHKRFKESREDVTTMLLFCQMDNVHLNLSNSELALLFGYVTLFAGDDSNFGLMPGSCVMILSLTGSFWLKNRHWNWNTISVRFCAVRISAVPKTEDRFEEPQIFRRIADIRGHAKISWRSLYKRSSSNVLSSGNFYSLSVLVRKETTSSVTATFRLLVIKYRFYGSIPGTWLSHLVYRLECRECRFTLETIHTYNRRNDLARSISECVSSIYIFPSPLRQFHVEQASV